MRRRSHLEGLQTKMAFARHETVSFWAGPSGGRRQNTGNPIELQGVGRLFHLCYDRVITAMPELLSVLEDFVENECIPSEDAFARELDDIEARTGSRWTEIPGVLISLKAKARSLGLWNLFMPKVILYMTLI